MTDVIKDFWGIFVAVVAAIVWLIRLEARGVANAAEIRRMWSQRREDMEAARESRAANERLLEEIRADVKQLIRDGGRK